MAHAHIVRSRMNIYDALCTSYIIKPCNIFFSAFSYFKQMVLLSGLILPQTGNGFHKVLDNSMTLQRKRMKHFRSTEHRTPMIFTRATVQSKAHINHLKELSRLQKHPIGSNLPYQYHKKHEKEITLYSTRNSQHTRSPRHHQKKVFSRNISRTKIQKLTNKRNSRKKIAQSIAGKKQEKRFQKMLDHSKSIGTYMRYKFRMKYHHPFQTHRILHSKRFRRKKLKRRTNHGEFNTLN